MSGLIGSIAECAPGPMPFRLIGAHDALSARLGEEAGFDGIWVGSLEVSASHAMPDNGRLPREEMVERVREIAAAVRSPVLVDAENGAGDLPATVRAIEEAGAAGLVLEDKASPRSNSLVPGPHRLRDVDAYCSLLREAREARASTAFAVVARVEALTSGASPDEAVARARAYAQAGADAVIVHSRSADGRDVLGVIREVEVGVPIGLIPTTFYRYGADELRQAGASFVVYANQGLRAKVEALRSVFRQIYQSGSSASVEDEIALVEDVVALHAKRP